MTTPPQFATDLEAHHCRLDAANYDDVYVVGDVHGSRATLERLVTELAVDADDLVVFVGDLVRKGPDSPGVLDLVRGRPELVSVRGNNEQKLLDGRADPDWLREGDLSFLASLPVAMSFDEALVVHGGVDPERPLCEHTVEDLLTTRAPHGDGYDGPFWYESYDGPHRVFFGHTVHDRPVEREYAVGLDTGCVYGGALTAYDYRRDRFVAVDPVDEHRYRSESKIVRPA